MEINSATIEPSQTEGAMFVDAIRKRNAEEFESILNRDLSVNWSKYLSMPTLTPADLKWAYGEASWYESDGQ